jgi:hypothetical protein
MRGYAGAHQMNRDRIFGAIIFAVSLAGVVLFFWLVFFVAPLLVLEITAFVAVALLLAIASSVGYTLAKPPTRSTEEIETEEDPVQAEAQEQSGA